jgi:DNA invertase Pin-like site-specific DNA recombinase
MLRNYKINPQKNERVSVRNPVKARRRSGNSRRLHGYANDGFVVSDEDSSSSEEDRSPYYERTEVKRRAPSWSCVACTFHNENMLGLSCGMCGREREGMSSRRDARAPFSSALFVREEPMPAVSSEVGQASTSRTPEESNSQVRKIIRHRIRRYLSGDPIAWCNEWQFFIKFEDGISKWVNDSECDYDCEEKISEYLAKEAPLIRTAFIICRVSTKAQTKGPSLDNQEAEVREAMSTPLFPIGIEDYDRVKVYKIGSSGFTGIPIKIKTLGKALRQGDALWVWRVDRLSRNVDVSVPWLENLTTKGVDVVACAEKITYARNRLEFIIKIADAQKEAESIGARGILSNHRKKQTRAEPYGSKCLRISKEDGTLDHYEVLPNREEQTVIERIMASSNCRDMANRLNSERIKNRGKPWNRLMVATIQRNYRRATDSRRQHGWNFVL